MRWSILYYQNFSRSPKWFLHTGKLSAPRSLPFLTLTIALRVVGLLPQYHGAHKDWPNKKILQVEHDPSYSIRIQGVSRSNREQHMYIFSSYPCSKNLRPKNRTKTTRPAIARFTTTSTCSSSWTTRKCVDWRAQGDSKSGMYHTLPLGLWFPSKWITLRLGLWLSWDGYERGLMCANSIKKL